MKLLYIIDMPLYRVIDHQAFERELRGGPKTSAILSGQNIKIHGFSAKGPIANIEQDAIERMRAAFQPFGIELIFYKHEH